MILDEVKSMSHIVRDLFTGSVIVIAGLALSLFGLLVLVILWAVFHILNILFWIFLYIFLFFVLIWFIGFLFHKARASR
jgi:hypothetical protein